MIPQIIITLIKLTAGLMPPNQDLTQASQEEAKIELSQSQIKAIKNLLFKCMEKLHRWEDHDSRSLRKIIFQTIDQVRIKLVGAQTKQAQAQVLRLNHGYFLYHQLNKDYQQLIKVYKYLQQQLSQTNSLNKTLQSMIKQEKEKVKQLQANKILQEENYKKKIDIATRQITDKLQKVFEAKLLDFKKSQRQSSRQTNESDQSTHVYLGQLLHTEPDFKDYLLEILALALKRRPTHARRLYQMDPLNQVNFHKYIDNHPNLLVVVRLKNSLMLAAFHEQPLAQKMESTGLGIIFSLSNRKCFRNQKKAVIYDSFHLIFGNSELKIMSGRNKIFSNLGINNGYYENHHQSVDILLGEGKNREVQAQHYEILELIFH